MMQTKVEEGVEDDPLFMAAAVFFILLLEVLGGGDMQGKLEIRLIFGQGT